MDFGILSLIPAAVTILVALLTHRVALSLFTGIIAGAFVYAGYQLTDFAESSYHYMVVSFTDIERLKIVLFVMLIGALLEIIAGSGAYNKFAERLSKRLNSGRRARVSTWGLSMCLFFDDYANVLISGASMRKINMKNNVTPAQLAYIVDVVAIMASIMIVSTWASYEGSVMAEAGANIGMNKSITHFFIESLPYHFYTYLAIILAFVVAFTGKWFGYKADNKKYKLVDGDDVNNKRAQIKHLLAPVLTLLGFAILALFVSGIYILLQEGQTISLINILGSAPSVDILILSTLLALGLSVYLLIKDKVIGLKTIGKRFVKGLKDMAGVSLVIIFARGLSAVSTDLGTGVFITDAISDYISPALLPFLIFVVSMLITVATGFSWSSMAIVMPIGFQLAVGLEAPDLIPVISAAVITGAVSGEHVIPFSEKAVMTSASCKISPVYHIKTQIFQTVAVFISAGLAFYLLGRMNSGLLAFIISLAILLILHFIFARSNRKAVIE